MFRERFTPQVIHTWHGYHQLFASHILVLVEQESIENYANVISIDVVLCGIWPYHNGVLLLHEKFLRSKNLGWKKKDLHSNDTTLKKWSTEEYRWTEDTYRHFGLCCHPLDLIDLLLHKYYWFLKWCIWKLSFCTWFTSCEFDANVTQIILFAIVFLLAWYLHNLIFECSHLQACIFQDEFVDCFISVCWSSESMVQVTVQLSSFI